MWMRGTWPLITVTSCTLDGMVEGYKRHVFFLPLFTSNFLFFTFAQDWKGEKVHSRLQCKCLGRQFHFIPVHVSTIHHTPYTYFFNVMYAQGKG